MEDNEEVEDRVHTLGLKIGKSYSQTFYYCFGRTNFWPAIFILELPKIEPFAFKEMSIFLKKYT